jgi:hypothetical protein
MPVKGPSLPSNLTDARGAEHDAAAEDRKAVALEEGEEAEETRWSDKGRAEPTRLNEAMDSSCFSREAGLGK